MLVSTRWVGSLPRQVFLAKSNLDGTTNGLGLFSAGECRTIPTMDPIYLDHNATTPVRPEVVEAISRCYRDVCGNPASQHRTGQHARKILEDAREGIAEILGANLNGRQPDRVVFTGGATEANNLAVLGMAQAAGKGPGQLIVSSVEHASVLEPAEHLLEQGWQLDTLPVTPDGVVRVDYLDRLVTPQTSLISVILGNHETGVLQPVEQLARLATEHRIAVHTDAVQVAGKLPIDFRKLGVAAMSVSSHKIGGPPGIGVLVVRHGTWIQPLAFGGHHQWGIRPGTEPVALAVGMCEALRQCVTQGPEYGRRLAELRDRFEQGLKASLPGLIVHGSGAERLPQTSNIAFPGVDSQRMLVALDMAGVACSVGSACASGSAELSPTLRAMGVLPELVGCSLRFSVGWPNTEEEVDEAARRIAEVYRRCRG